ncbi:MAG: hypothetical protein IPJ33_19880 [Gammaproteobacteria bacterium]|jgi:hypothetical protein|nr:hypothetical protein [Gammaproteobacteria bacterium]MBP6052075.1 hypothetical protein [Pseudomonadales bacterium]MBK6585223.1 hypothetical protein [Gammaproteobacteria bacterium]MBK7169100.1 hypothetical protein [Gammaproteobacteria bacterium]MBK7520054.1 hypothetical protein [Gammaproteobacteria bacterium]
MKRVHAIEFEDVNWFPQGSRNYMTEFYHSQMLSIDLYQPATALLADVLRKTDQTLTVDLRSGGTGPNQLLQHQFKQDHGLAVKVMLTDKFPNIPAFETIHKKTRG